MLYGGLIRIIACVLIGLYLGILVSKMNNKK
nr:MAG TPA: Protein of unknown function (DUF1043) [Caudoviricetes sp.]